MSLQSPRIKVSSNLISPSSYNLRATPSRMRSRKKKLNQLSLGKRGQYHVYDSAGVDRTPKLLYDSDYQVLEDWQPTVLDIVDADLTASGSQISISRSVQQASSLYSSRHMSSSVQMSFTNIANVDSYKEPTTRTLEVDLVSEARSEDTSEMAPSAFRLMDLPSREFYPPHTKVPIVAKETDSFTLFSLTSVVESATSARYNSILAENESYKYITEGKGRYTRKLYSSEQQTVTSMSTPEYSYCPRMATKNGSSWVTPWILYDEYSNGEEKKNLSGLAPEEQWSQLSEDEKFVNQCVIMNRVLGAPKCKHLQIMYKRSAVLDPLDLEVWFSYSARTLWVYNTPLTQKKAVMDIAFNPLFPDIIAVAHGKFLYTEPDAGFISIWSVKNPSHPERFYTFTSTVNCLDFAQWTPNLLAAGFLNGDLLVLDVSSVEKKIIFTKNSVACDSYDRVTFTKWWFFTDIFERKDERLMITTGDGRIIQFLRTNDALIPIQMMRIAKAEGRVKGIEQLEKCEAEEISMVRFPAAHCVVRYPSDDQFYLVSGEDGTVHKCSTNFSTQHVESFFAHTGPVYALKFSPFCNKIFLTCGADGTVRLWVWDIFEPVITLNLGPQPVQDADWSPRNSTIIASITGPDLSFWDLRRKTYHPTSTITHPENIKFCRVKFTKTGNNILLGDIEGSIYVMALFGMPFEEKFKEEVLAASIEKELVVKPKLLKLLKKSGPPFSP